MNEDGIVALRLERQHLVNKIDNHRDYEKFFKLMQPVAPVYFSAPGDAPTLVHRTTFDDQMHNDNLRSKRCIVKARFQGGNVGYVYLDELEIYIAAYKKELPYLDFNENIIYDLLLKEGPLTIHQIKEEIGLLAKEIKPILIKLQKAFYVFEDQVDTSLERGWYILTSELEMVDINRYTVEEAVLELVKRALHLLVFVDLKELKSWLRLPVKSLKNAINSLIKMHELKKINVNEKEGYILTKDYKLLQDDTHKIEKSVFVLHKSDILVKAFESSLKEQFKNHEILQYILIDGKFQGAICGHWRIGPHDVSDIVLTIPDNERKLRKEEIIKAVKKFYQAPFSHVLKYDGKTLKEEKE